MNRQENFLKAVQVRGPGDPFIVKAAAEVPDESLPAAPGGGENRRVQVEAGGSDSGADRNPESPGAHVARRKTIPVRTDSP
jgi:hypothetical protein